MNNTQKTDINGKDIFVGDTVRIDDELFIVKFGDYTFLGTKRAGYFIEAKGRVLNSQLPLGNGDKVEKI